MKAVPANRYAVFFSMAVVGCLVDLATKWWMFRRLGMPGQKPTWWLWDDVFGFQTSLNEGALFGMGQGWVVLFAGLSIVAAVGIVIWLFLAGAARDLLLTITLALIIAGICGNLYDRLGLPGLRWNYANQLHQVGEPVHAVRDWILAMTYLPDRRLPFPSSLLRWRWQAWPTFNIADSLLVCGAGLLIWHACRHDGRRQHEPAGNAP